MKRKLFFLLCALLTSVGMWAYTTSDLTSAGWTQVTSLSNISSNYYILIGNNVGYTSGKAVAHDWFNTGSLYYQTLSDPATDVKEVWGITSSGDGTYSLRALNDGHYVNGNNNGWNRSVDVTKTTGDFTITQNEGAWHIVCTSGSYSPGSTFGPWEGTKTDGTDMRVAINKKNNSTAAGDGDNAPGFILYSIPRSEYTGATEVDVTSTYITNAGFDACTAETSDVATQTKKDYSSNGWSNAATGTYTTIAVTAYGGEKKVGGSTTPSTKKDGTTVSGNTLGIIAGWGDEVKIQSGNITLPAGVYTLTVDHYLTSSTNNYASSSSRFGFVTSSTSYLVSSTSFTASTWTTETITFCLAEETTGKVQIGLKGEDKSGSGSPAVFYDDIKLEYTSSVIPYANSISQKQTLTGTIDLPTSDFIPTAGAFTIEGTATAGSAIALTSLGINYTPVKSGAIRFVRTTDNAVLVYEGEEFMTAFASGDVCTFTEITSSNVTSSEANLLSNASFETLGSEKTTNQYNPGTPWAGDIASNARVQLISSMESGQLTPENGEYLLVWRGAFSKYITQPVSGLKAYHTYKVQACQIFANNGTDPFRFGLGSSAGGTQYGYVDITMGGTGDKNHHTWSGTFKTSSTTATSGHFTLTGCTTGQDRMPCIDWISLVCQDDCPVSGMTSPKYLVGSAYAPVMISEIRAEFDEVYASIATTLNDANYANITGSERTALETAKDETYYEFSSDDPKDYEDAISDINDLIATFTAAKTSYDNLVAVRTTGETYTTVAWPRASAAKKTALDNAIAAAPTNATDAGTKADAIVTAYRQFVESNGLAEGVSGAIDFASAIAGADPDVNEEWTNGVNTDFRSWEAYTDGDGNLSGKYYDGGWSTSEGANVNMTRTLTLPAGTYQLQVTARGSEDLTKYTMSIGGESVNLPTDGSGTDVGTFGHGWSDRYVVFTSNGSELTLAIQATSTEYQQWISFNRFRLYNLGDATVSATIGATGWTTFASEYALDLSKMSASTGTVKAYYASEVGGGNVTMTSTDKADVEAGTGLMLKGTPTATITIPVAASGTEIDGNMLKGCVSETVLEKDATSGYNNYVLVNNGGVAQFQSLSANGATIPAGKAYLQNGTYSAGARLTIILEDEVPTAINAIEATDAKAEGLKDGKYLVKGKIVLVKNGVKFNANGQILK